MARGIATRAPTATTRCGPPTATPTSGRPEPDVRTGQRVDLITDGTHRASAQELARDPWAANVPGVAAGGGRGGRQLGSEAASDETVYLDGHPIELTGNADDGIWIEGLPGEAPGRVGDLLVSPEDDKGRLADRFFAKGVDEAEDLVDSVEKNVSLTFEALQRPPVHAEVPVEVHHPVQAEHHDPDAGNLATAALVAGPAVVALPVTFAGGRLAGVAGRWFQRAGRTDELSRLVKAATGTTVSLAPAEFDAVRKLLEDPQTWLAAGRGTVGDLAARIESCLPPREGRTDEDSRAAALAIARGLLEFAVADLEPGQFQQLLLARLERMEAGQASDLDRVLISLHGDLAAGFAGVMGQLARVLNRLPPGPADRAGVVVYLRALAGWLNTDPWPRDQAFGGPALVPAAIERKLMITDGPGQGARDLAADDLAGRCARLVVLGGPGSGKTWLARRAARRCAERALQALQDGSPLDEVELPLYTTCAWLAAALQGDGIRRAVVAGALGQLPDLGGARVLEALRVPSEERNAPVLLVADSLDEARGADDRIRQADTLPPQWRIMLTSRPSSWNHQLEITGNGPERRADGRMLPGRRLPDRAC